MFCFGSFYTIYHFLISIDHILVMKNVNVIFFISREKQHIYLQLKLSKA